MKIDIDYKKDKIRIIQQKYSYSKKREERILFNARNKQNKTKRNRKDKGVLISMSKKNINKYLPMSNQYDGHSVPKH